MNSSTLKPKSKWSVHNGKTKNFIQKSVDFNISSANAFNSQHFDFNIEQPSFFENREEPSRDPTAEDSLCQDTPLNIETQQVLVQKNTDIRLGEKFSFNCQ